MARAKTCQEAITPGSDAVEKQLSDKLQLVAQSDKLKHVGQQTALLPNTGNCRNIVEQRHWTEPGGIWID
jgi:hypothetical protein